MLKEAGLYSIRTYVWRRQARIAEYIATRPIHQLCLQALPRSGSSSRLRWWTQDHRPEVDEDFQPQDGDSAQEDVSESIGDIESEEIDDMMDDL